MSKVYEPQIDPDEFIRSFREEPSGLSSLKTKTAGEDVPDVATDKEAISVNDDDSVIYETEYLETFVSTMAYMRPRSRFLMVEIDPDFIQKIKRIISYGSAPTCSVKCYVNNVLAEHFKTYEKIIQKRL